MPYAGACMDLFCGAGGLSYGFSQAGFDIRLGVDVDASALLTFERNHPHARVLKEDVRQLTGAKLSELAGNVAIFGIIGGPPCQGFSVAGNHDPDDIRNQLPYEYARLLKEVQPAFFLMENVKGLLSKKQRVHFDAIYELFTKAGYKLDWRLLCAWDYGIAQTRERVFIIGFRTDLNVSFDWPDPDPSRPVLRDAIGDLPDPVSEASGWNNHALSNLRPPSMENRLNNLGKGVALFDCKVQDWNKPCKTVTAHLSKDVDLAHPGSPPNHEGHLFDNVRSQGGYDQENRTMGWESPSHTITAHNRSAMLHPNHGPVPSDSEQVLRLISQADPNGVIPLEALQDEMPSRIEGLKGRQKRGAWHKPNPTITAQTTFYTGAHYHPDGSRPRRFTVRECARIQSFGDDFVFYGSLSAQYRQVGNAVPPKLAYVLACQIAKAFRGR